MWSSSGTVGTDIYILGGDMTAAGGISQAIQKYDTLDNTWTTIPALQAPVAGAAAASLGNRIFLAGGTGFDPDNLNSPKSYVLAYDVPNEKTALIGMLQLPRHWAEADIVDNVMYVAGGEGIDINGRARTLDSMERIDLSTGASTLIPMPTPRSGAAAIAVPPTPQHPAGRLLVFGGYTGYGGFTADCFAYDPATDNIAPVSPMPYPGMTKGAGVIGTKAYVVLSHNLSASSHSPVLAYDTATDTWEEVSAVPSPRDGAEAKIVAGTLYAIGGWDNGIGANEALTLPSEWPGPVDGTAPVTTAEVSGPRGQYGWIVGQLSVKLTAEDNPGGSGVALTEYSFYGSNWFMYSGNPIVIDAPSPLTFRYRSRDFAGNIEDPPKSVNIPVDAVAPITGAFDNCDFPGGEGWCRGPVAVTLEPSDSGSGVASTSFQVGEGSRFAYAGPFSVTQEGVLTVTYRSTDVAGNVESDKSYPVRIDRTPPAVSATREGTAGQNGWYVSDVKVALSANDALSGVASIEYGFDGSTWNRYAGPLVVTKAGLTHVFYRATDFAGNTAPIVGFDIAIDKTEGIAWTASGNGIGSLEIFATALSPGYASDRTAFAATANESAGVYRTTDGGASWVLANSGLPSGQIRFLAISPEFPVDRTLFAFGRFGGVFRSTDAGNSWLQLSYGPFSGSGEPGGLVLSPGFPADNTLFVAWNATVNGSTYGQIFGSIDGGANWDWVSKNTSIMEVDSLAISPDFVADGTILAGTNHQILKSVDRGANWIEVHRQGNNFVSLAFSPDYRLDHTVLAGTNGAGVLRTVDGGANWTPLSGGLPRTQSGYLMGIPALAVSPAFALDNTVFAGTAGGGLFASADRGISWQTIHGDIEGLATVRTLNVSSGYAADRTLLAGTYSDGIWISRVAVQKPSCNLDAPGAGALLTDASVTISGTASDGSGSGIAQVELSVDGGSSWTPVSGTTDWRYDWGPTSGGPYSLTARATDFAGNVGASTPPVSVFVDNTAPIVQSTIPTAGQLNVPIGDNIAILYSEHVKEGPAFGGIVLKKGKGIVKATVRIEGNSVIIDPDAALSRNSQYVVTIPAGAVKDAIGNATIAETKFSFTTVRR